MTQTSAPSVLRFDRFEIDRQAMELRAAGERVALGPQPVRLLELLVERAGTLVSREELYAALWPDGEVDVDRALNTCVRQVRVALRAHAGDREFIHTYPRRGYRFDMPETADAPAASARSAPRPRVGTIVAVLAAAAAVVTAGWVLGHRRAASQAPRVVVLPFEVLGGGHEDEVLARGLTENILTSLAAVEPGRLRVMGWTPATPAARTPADFAREMYEADFVVVGSLEPDDGSVVVHARLMRAHDGEVLWAERFHRSRLATVTVEREIASRVAGSLLGRASSVEPRAGPAPTPDAEIDYLEGRYLLRHPDVWRRPEAAPYFERVVARDSQFAPAYAGLAEAHFWAQRPVEARRAVDRALTLDPDEPQALYVRSNLRVAWDWDWAGAERDARRAIALLPGRPDFHQGYAFILSTAGRHDEAIRELELAYALDPVSPGITGDLGYIYFWAGRFERAAELCRRTVEIEPAAAQGDDCAFAAYTQLGRWGDAARHAARMVAAAGDAPDQVLGTGNGEDAVRRFRTWRVDRLTRAVAVGQGSRYWLAVAEADAGNAAQALAQLELAAAERPMAYVTLRVEPRFARLRGDARFAALVHQLDMAGDRAPPAPRGP